MFDKMFEKARLQQMGRRDAGVMGQGIGRGLQQLQAGLDPSQNRPGADFQEQMRQSQEQQRMQPQFDYGYNPGDQIQAGQQRMQPQIGGLAAMSKMREMYGDRPQNDGIGAPLGGGAIQPYERMQQPDQRADAVNRMREMLIQGRPKAPTGAGYMRQMMLERARKRKMMQDRYQRNRYNPFLNR